MSALNAQGARQRKAALQGLTLGETRNEVTTQTVACNVSSITGNLTQLTRGVNHAVANSIPNFRERTI